MIRQFVGAVKTTYNSRVTSTPGMYASSQSSIQIAGQIWYVRPYQATDEASLIELYELVFSRPRSVEVLRWKLLARNIGPAEMVWVAVAKGSERVIGHYAGIPLEIKLAGRVARGIHSVEAMAHPDYRRQGILTALGTTAHQEWARHGYEVVIGLPNDKWGTRNAALGYKQQFPLTWLKFPLRLDRVLKRRFPSRIGRIASAAPARAASWLWRHIYITRHTPSEDVHVVPLNLSETSSGIESIWAALGPLYPHAVVRSSSWLRWRYGEEPAGAFKVLMSKIGPLPTGFIAYRVVASKERVTGCIADLFVVPDSHTSARALITRAFNHLEKLGAGSVMAVAPPGSPAYLHLYENGFRTTNAGFTFEIVPLSMSIEQTTLGDPSQWHLAAGDFDIV